MNIDTAKLQLVRKIMDINEPEIIEQISRLLDSKQIDFGFELTEAENRELELGLQQLNDGQRISYETFLERIG
jgi:hypothetical protein